MPEPLAIPCLCAAARRATRAISRFYELRMASTGLTITQYTLLRVLASTAAPIPQSQLADIVLTDSTTLTRVLALMLKADLIRTTPDKADRRSKPWSITPKGKALLTKAEPLWHKAQSDAKRALGEDHFDNLRRNLLTVGTALAN
ncbi:MAG: MarR family transcriptional regulator [Phycisphaerales bacterium]|nr:MarR family transcriptional regulator [Phycisphaerales bacterium]